MLIALVEILTMLYILEMYIYIYIYVYVGIDTGIVSDIVEYL